MFLEVGSAVDAFGVDGLVGLILTGGEDDSFIFMEAEAGFVPREIEEVDDFFRGGFGAGCQFFVVHITEVVGVEDGFPVVH